MQIIFMNTRQRAAAGLRAGRCTFVLALVGLLCVACGHDDGTAQAAEASRAAEVTAESAIVTMCAENYPVAVCRCAMPAFEKEVGAEAAVYEAISAQLLAKRAQGLEYIPAWEAAIEAVASDQGVASHALQIRMNPVGRAHSTAIDACKP